jgi:hypothetical protein
MSKQTEMNDDLSVAETAAPPELETFIDELYARYDGDYSLVAWELADLARTFAPPPTIGQLARDFWHECGGRDYRCEQKLLEQFGQLSADMKAAVLAEADAVITRNSDADKAWASSLIDNSKRIYKFHLAVALGMALAQPMFRHVTGERIAHLFDRTVNNTEGRFVALPAVVEEIARNCGLKCNDCN